MNVSKPSISKTCNGANFRRVARLCHPHGHSNSKCHASNIYNLLAEAAKTTNEPTETIAKNIKSNQQPYNLLRGFIKQQINERPEKLYNLLENILLELENKTNATIDKDHFFQRVKNARNIRNIENILNLQIKYHKVGLYGIDANAKTNTLRELLKEMSKEWRDTITGIVQDVYVRTCAPPTLSWLGIEANHTSVAPGSSQLGSAIIVAALDTFLFKPNSESLHAELTLPTKELPRGMKNELAEMVDQIVPEFYKTLLLTAVLIGAEQPYTDTSWNNSEHIKEVWFDQFKVAICTFLLKFAITFLPMLLSYCFEKASNCSVSSRPDGRGPLIVEVDPDGNDLEMQAPTSISSRTDVDRPPTPLANGENSQELVRGSQQEAAV